MKCCYVKEKELRRMAYISFVRMTQISSALSVCGNVLVRWRFMSSPDAEGMRIASNMHIMGGKKVRKERKKFTIYMGGA